MALHTDQQARHKVPPRAVGLRLCRVRGVAGAQGGDWGGIES